MYTAAMAPVLEQIDGDDAFADLDSSCLLNLRMPIPTKWAQYNAPIRSGNTLGELVHLPLINSVLYMWTLTWEDRWHTLMRNGLLGMTPTRLVSAVQGCRVCLQFAIMCVSGLSVLNGIVMAILNRTMMPLDAIAFNPRRRLVTRFDFSCDCGLSRSGSAKTASHISTITCCVPSMSMPIRPQLSPRNGAHIQRDKSVSFSPGSCSRSCTSTYSSVRSA